MRLLRVYIDGYRNLKNVTVDFDKDSLTTVVIGENGSGKSNLIEAIVEVFRAWDLGRTKEVKFRYKILYLIQNFVVEIESGSQPVLMVRFLNPATIDHELNIQSPHFYATVEDESLAEIAGGFSHVLISGQIVIQVTSGANFWAALEKEVFHAVEGNDLKYVPSNFSAQMLLPDLIFGYYSGTGRKLEKLFDAHQSRYYGIINKERSDEEYEAARIARRLFYCRPVHGVLALLSYLAKPGTEKQATALLTEKLGITGFHSALAHFKEPSWFNHNNWQKKRSLDEEEAGRGRRTYGKLGEQSWDIWGARGPAGKCARTLRDIGFHPLTIAGKVVDDYRQKPRTEAQLACFLRDEKALKTLATNYKTDQEMFATLEAADISDLFRDMIVWVTRTNDASGDISFSDLSDGERQLLMVLGLIRVSRGKEALFLLDEPDTHLNPSWQLTYLELIREWTEVAADEDKCQIIMTTHNPLTIAALEAKEVRVMSSDDDGKVSVAPPRIDPKGLGFAGVLTDIFGLSSSLDKPTQERIDRRNELAKEEHLTPAMAKEFADIKEELRHLGFLYEERDKLYSEFLRQLDTVELADVDPLTPDELRAREAESREIVEKLLKKQ